MKHYIVNLAFGITFLNLAIVGICNLNLTSSFMAMVQVCAIACNTLMGIMILFNTIASSSSSPLHNPHWLGMIACNIALVKLIDATHPLCGALSLLFLVGFVIVIISVLSIGRSFAVTPMLSQIKTRHIYRMVRHPMYLGEILMITACFLTSITIVSSIVMALFIVFAVLRIREEEKLLLKSDSYKQYCITTPWRIIPHLW